MRGFGGGRPAKRPKLDGGLKLDLYRLKRQGWLVPGASTSGSLTWTSKRTGAQIAAIGFAVTATAEGGSARLTYTTTLHDGRRVASDYSIALASTSQPFGGRRWWFLCPITGTRAAVLYLPAAQTRFASQAGLRGSYRTQRIADHDRAMELAQDINMGLGGDGDLFDFWTPKPPRMRWSTYRRKLERAERARAVSLGWIAAYLDRTAPAPCSVGSASSVVMAEARRVVRTA